MAPKVPRTPFNSATLVRLLSTLGDVEVAAPEPSLAQQLGVWLGWAEAISLSTVLNAASHARPARVAGGGSIPAGDTAQECARVRAHLARAIATDERFAPAPAAPAKSSKAGAPPPAPGDDFAEEPASFAPYRRSYVAHQRAMESSIAPLRAQLRSALARCSPRLGQLAALDEVMENVVAAHERQALANVPSLLERRFKRLAAQARPATADGPAPAAPWLDGYRRDVQAVLLAELDIRLQPVEGLIDALGQEITRPPQA